jgi:hypothetical protein
MLDGMGVKIERVREATFTRTSTDRSISEFSATAKHIGGMFWPEVKQIYERTRPRALTKSRARPLMKI